MPNTVIFKWNPAISSYNMVRFLENIVREDPECNWSVWEHDRVHKGDTFYMLKVGQGQTGVVSRGKITSEPYKSDDWSGRGRVVYYCDFKADIMLSPDTFPILSSQQLEDGIPGFDWYAGHSGAVLDEKQSEVLEMMWDAYLLEHKEEFNARLELINERDLYNDQLFLAPAFKRKLFAI